uniref:RING-type domain-containing protein n=1 Tax=Cuerna arida TaxID=1464854 RepID=A0A1B6FRR0_9HEMI
MSLNRLSMRHKEKENVKTNPISRSQFDDVESKLSLLSIVLSDAQPEYLMKQSQRISSQEELLTFISQSLESHNYPKLELEDTKIMEQFECTVEEFLMGIPDPVKEFSDSYIRTGYEENAEIYLKSRYQNLALCMDIKELLMTHKYNLTNVCQQLDSLGMKANPYNLDLVQLHHSPSVFFHQEVWYIEHKEEVLNFLKSAIEAARVEAELNRPPTPPSVEEIFECEICRNDIEDYAELGTCDGPAGHLFCNDCVRRSAEIKFAEGGITFPCLINCGGYIPLQIIKDLLERGASWNVCLIKR